MTHTVLKHRDSKTLHLHLPHVILIGLGQELNLHHLCNVTLNLRQERIKLVCHHFVLGWYQNFLREP